MVALWTRRSRYKDTRILFTYLVTDPHNIVFWLETDVMNLYLWKTGIVCVLHKMENFLLVLVCITVWNCDKKDERVIFLILVTSHCFLSHLKHSFTNCKYKAFNLHQTRNKKSQVCGKFMYFSKILKKLDL